MVYTISKKNVLWPTDSSINDPLITELKKYSITLVEKNACIKGAYYGRYTKNRSGTKSSHDSEYTCFALISCYLDLPF